MQDLGKLLEKNSIACYKSREVGHFQRDCKYNRDKTTDGQQEQEGSFDSYDPVVGKWMNNLVATTHYYGKSYEESMCWIE